MMSIEDHVSLEATSKAPVSNLSSQLDGLILTRAGVAESEIAPRPFNITYAPNGIILGGLTGYSHGGYLTVLLLWVSEEVRGKGVGANLMKLADREAVRRGCIACLLSTFGFQAEVFYNKQGYRRIAVIPGAWDGKTEKIYLEKVNNPTNIDDSINDPNYTVADGQNSELAGALTSGLEEHSKSFGSFNYAPLYITSTPLNPSIPVALVASTSASILIISKVWIDPAAFDEHTTNETGVQLLELAMAEGLARRCQSVVAQVFDYDGAVPAGVYAKLGFETLGVTTGWWGKFTRTIMYKSL